MSTINRFEDLDCWKAARILVKEIYLISSSGKLSRDFGLRDQFRRSALSTMNNIAEGFGRNHTKDMIRFLDISQSSAAEIKSMLYVLEDLDFLEKKKIEILHQNVDDVRKLTLGFIKYLNKP